MPAFTFAGDAADPPVTRVGAELRHTYANMLNTIPGNAKPTAAEFRLRVGSFNFQDPEGVLTRLAGLAGQPLNLSSLTVVDIGGGGHTPPAMRPFLGVSRYISFDASSSSIRAGCPSFFTLAKDQYTRTYACGLRLEQERELF